MKNAYILYFGFIVFFGGCELSQRPDSKEYIGRYEISIPIERFDHYNKKDSISTRYYFLMKEQLNRSFLEINPDSSFFVRNSVLKDSMGVWKVDWSPESGSWIALYFKHYNIISNLYYEEDGYVTLPKNQTV